MRDETYSHLKRIDIYIAIKEAYFVKRTVEKVLSIISAVLTVIGVILSFAILAFLNFIKSDPAFQDEFRTEIVLFNPTLNPTDIETFFTIFNFLGGFMWLIIIALIISLVLIVIGLVNIWNNNNPKLAGILFVIAGVLGGFLNITSILLYIAGILCFIKKPPLTSRTPVCRRSV